MKTDYKLGDTLPDDTIYLGCINGVHSCVVPNQEMETMTWDAAHEKYGDALPDRYECLMLYELYLLKPELFNFGEIKAFWSARRGSHDGAYCQWVDDGLQRNGYRDRELPVSPVRRFKSFSDLVIPSPLEQEIAKLEEHTGLNLSNLKKFVRVEK